MSDNLHPVDELFDLRCQKVAMESRIDELRAIIVALPANEREGRHAKASVHERSNIRIDIDRVKYEMGQKWVDERSTSKPYMLVKVSPL